MRPCLRVVLNWLLGLQPENQRESQGGKIDGYKSAYASVGIFEDQAVSERLRTACLGSLICLTDNRGHPETHALHGPIVPHLVRRFVRLSSRWCYDQC